jgi:hypothetical protein
VLLDKHEEPFKTIAKTTTDVSLITISASIEDFQDVIKALPQTTEIDMPGRPKRFVAIGIAIAAMALSSFNAYRITELNNEISALKSKTDLLVDVSNLHEAHHHHLEEKTDATNNLLVDLPESNVWFTTKITAVHPHRAHSPGVQRQSTSTSHPTFPSHLMSARTTSWLSGTQNLFKLSPALICTHASTSETPSFAREGK